MSTLTFALSIDTHSRSTRASVDFMAALAAGYLLDHLAAAGFVLMRQAPQVVPSQPPAD